MRNNDRHLVNEWARDVEEFVEKAKEVTKNGKRYPRVFFAAQKNNKWGITLPGVFNIAHSANNCPDGYNSELWATAWALKVEELLRVGNYTYLEWCQKYNYLNRGNNSWFTNAEYIRQDVMKSGKEYSLWIPQTGHEYQRVDASPEMKNFVSLKQAIYRRNQILFSMVTKGTDLYGPICEEKVRKLSRVLTKGYFQAISPYQKCDISTPDEIKIARYNGNLDIFARTFNNAQRFCEDDVLRNSFAYFEELFKRELSFNYIDDFDDNYYIVLEYFKAIGLFSTTKDCFCAMSRNERNKCRNTISRISQKHA